jgi:outer membrane receptor protein involved in Fe transport
MRCPSFPLTCLAAGALVLSKGALAQSASSVTLPAVQVNEAAGTFNSRYVQVGAFRDQDPLDVPLTNNVVTRELLDAQGGRTLFDALRNTAGVTRSQLSGSTYDNISIRGILVENRGNYRASWSRTAATTASTVRCRSSTSSISRWRTRSGSRCSRARRPCITAWCRPAAW